MSKLFFDSAETVRALGRRANAIRWNRYEEADRLSVEIMRLRAAHFRKCADDLEEVADGVAVQLQRKYEAETTSSA